MYKVLIVDDEEPARETFNYLIDWGKTPFQICKFANNGKDALEKYELLKPDLIITDIQMPVMDGLELIKRIRERNKSQKFVILTCHEDFEYAREAIKLGVSDYLLKDLLTPQDLYGLLEKIADELMDEDVKHSGDYNNLSGISFNEIFYKEEYRNAILKGIAFENLTASEIQKHITRLGLNLTKNNYIILCIVIDDFSRLVKSIDRSQEKRHIYEILGCIKNVLDEFNGGECFYDENGIFAAIAGLDNKSSEQFNISFCNAVSNMLHVNLLRLNGMTVTIGISSVFSNLKELRQRYTQASEATRYRVLQGKGRTFLYNNELAGVSNSGIAVLEGLLNEVRSSIENDDLENIKPLIKNIYFNNVKGIKQYEHLKYINTQLMGMMIDYCRKKNISSEKVFGIDGLPIEKLDELETIQEMYSWFYGILDNLINCVKEKCPAPVYSKHVRYAMKYIDENYSSRLGLSQISEELGVNKAYLCRIFKQETGENITNYLNNLRIEKAKELMLSSNYRIYEISEKVGFANIQHFNNSFKKYTGQNPLKYKNNMEM